MKRIILAAVMIALATAPGLFVLLAGPSFAQRSMPDRKEAAPPPKKNTDDSHYKAAIERLPEKKFDPWRDMR